MSIQFNVCPLNHVSILREMFTDRMKSNIWWRCCVTATHWIAPPDINAFAWYVFCLGAVHNTLISTSSISTDLDTQEFFGFLPICLASCSCMSLRSLLSLSLRHSSLTMFSAELKEKSGSTIDHHWSLAIPHWSGKKCSSTDQVLDFLQHSVPPRCSPLLQSVKQPE